MSMYIFYLSALDAYVFLKKVMQEFAEMQVWTNYDLRFSMLEYLL